MKRRLIPKIFFIIIFIVYSCLTISFYNISLNDLFRVTELNFIEMVLSVYDPYSSKLTQLYPEDWQGWPSDATPLYLAGDWLNKQNVGNFEIKFSNHPVDDRALGFSYESMMVNELKQLRALYHLEDQVNRSTFQIEQLSILNNFTRSQWVHGINNKTDFFRFNALDILKMASNGERFWCQPASMTFIQVVVSVGYQARLISLFSNYKDQADHAVVEVWVDDFAKWVVFDTDFNLYYTNKFGIPLNALELHRALMSGVTKDIRVVKGRYRPESFDIETADAQPLLLPYYKYFCIEMRNDWLSRTYFRGHPKRSDQNSICWLGKNISSYGKKRISQYESDFYWPLNSVDCRITIDVLKNDSINLKIYLKTMTPNFDRFQAKMQNEGDMNNPLEISTKSSLLSWQLVPGTNLLEVNSVNNFGLKGPKTYISITWLIPSDFPITP